MSLSFIGRTAEIGLLRDLTAPARARGSLALVYGQRRTGKTHLLQHALGDDPDALYFLADETSAPEQIARFRQESRERFGALAATSDGGWGAALGELCRGAALAGRRLVLIIDEVQYLLAAEPAFASLVQRLHDELRARYPIHWVLCGSALGTLSRLGDVAQPLHGRFDTRIRLRTFDYRDAARFVPSWAPVDALRLWGVFGGLARHLAEVDPARSLLDNVQRAIVSPHGALYDAPLDLLRAERLSSTTDAQSILSAVAAGENQFNTIAARAALTAPRTDYVLKELLELEVVERVVRHGDRPGAKYVRYRCADPLTTFWYRLVAPSRSYATMAGAARAVEARIAPRLSDHMGPMFERIAESAIRAGVLGGVPEALSPYWSRDGATEIDWVVEAEGVRVFVECKWRADGAVTTADLHQLRGHVQRSGLFRSGDRLALVAAGGFAPELTTVARTEGVQLVGATELFAA